MHVVTMNITKLNMTLYVLGISRPVGAYAEYV